MGFRKVIGKFKSSDDKSTINYYIYEPIKKPIIGILQISHGMNEYIERYEEFADYLTDNGILVCGNDHLGHGVEALKSNTQGFFAKKDGDKYLVADLKKLNIVIKKRYGKLPYYLMGHSMGSFVVRQFLVKYPDMVDGAIFMGTSGANPFVKIGKKLAKKEIKKNGLMYRSENLKEKSSLGYNAKWKSESSPNAWLTRNKEVVKKYDEDPLSNFVFTASGYLDLFTLLDNVSSKAWASKVKKDIPILLVSGADDPVGNYLKGVNQVNEWLKETGHTNVQVETYDGGRHEIINEVNRKEVYKDICVYMLKNLDAYGNYQIKE